jgi:hypothetical protein
LPTLTASEEIERDASEFEIAPLEEVTVVNIDERKILLLLESYHTAILKPVVFQKSNT